MAVETAEAAVTAVTADGWRSGGGDYDGMKPSQCHPAAMVTVTDRVPCRPAHSAAVDATVTLIKWETVYVFCFILTIVTTIVYDRDLTAISGRNISDSYGPIDTIILT